MQVAADGMDGAEWSAEQPRCEDGAAADQAGDPRGMRAIRTKGRSVVVLRRRLLWPSPTGNTPELTDVHRKRRPS